MSVARAAVKDEYSEAKVGSAVRSLKYEVAASRISDRSWAKTEVAAAKMRTGVKRMLLEAT